MDFILYLLFYCACYSTTHVVETANQIVSRGISSEQLFMSVLESRILYKSCIDIAKQIFTLSGLRLYHTTNIWNRVYEVTVRLKMGNLLRVLHCKDEAYDDIFLDFEDARPSENEKEVYTQVSHVLSFAPGIIKELEAYKGAGGPIREAIQNPSSGEKQKEAWDAIIPLVHQLKKFFEFSLNLEKCLQELLRALTSDDQTTTQHLEAKQALAKQFAEILQYTLKFDDLKMNNPAIQNDFSYFRRIMSRRGMNNASTIIDYNEGQFISTELANKMSLFYAEATPMLKTLSDATTKFVSENVAIDPERTSEVLSTMCNICKVMLENPVHMQRFQMGEDTVHFCLRVMVGVIILYDHVHPAGAFCKGSRIDIKGVIKVLKDQHQGPIIDNLLNALRYTTKHLNDETTPKAIRASMQPGS